MPRQNKEAEHGHKVRILQVMLYLLESPNGRTRQEIATKFGMHVDSVKNYFDNFETAGLLLTEPDFQFRYRFREEKPMSHLKDLLHFSEEDQLLLMAAIDQISPHTQRGEALKRKLASLYDYHRLGHAYLRRPYLSKIDALTEARNNKKQVILQDYHSTNSNVVANRRVEPFHLSPPEDIVQAFDVDKQGLRYFRLSRFARVQATDEPWAYEALHRVLPADPFRIVDSQQETAHIRLSIGAYNDLMERYPLCKAYVQEAAEPDCYDLQCPVNHRFIALTNFLLGNYDGVEVVAPESLREHLQRVLSEMRF